MTRETSRGQVLAFFALVLPMVLLPIAAYAVDAAIVAGRAAGLQAATAQAAEAGAQKLDVGAIRSSGRLALDDAAVSLVAARTLGEDEPAAIIESSTVNGVEVTVTAREQVTLPFSVLTSSVELHAHATARLVGGYDKPT